MYNTLDYENLKLIDAIYNEDKHQAVLYFGDDYLKYWCGDN